MGKKNTNFKKKRRHEFSEFPVTFGSCVQGGELFFCHLQ